MRKRWFGSILLLACVLALGFGIHAKAADSTVMTEDGYTLNLVSKKDSEGNVIEEYYIASGARYSGEGDELVIMDSYDGIPVQEVQGFNNIASFTSVVIPEGVTRVSGFCHCENLESVTLPDSLAYLGNGSYSDDLTGVYETGCAFAQCEKLSEVNATFDNLTEYYTPSRTTPGLFADTPWMIAYKECNDPVVLGSVLVDFTSGDLVIPEGVTFIGYYLLYKNDNLKSIVFPKSFEGKVYGVSGKNLKTIEVASGNPQYFVRDNVLYTYRDEEKTKIRLFAYPAGKTDASFTVPENVNLAGDFAGNEYLQSVSFAGSEIEIDEGAFNDCINLESITFPENTTVWAKAFANTAIEKLELPAGFDCPYMGSSGYFAFIDMPKLQEITIPESNENYQVIDNVLFTKDGTYLVTYPAGRPDPYYNIPDGVESVWSGFTYCKNLQAIYVPKSVTTIVGHFRDQPSESYPGCDNLTDIYYEGTEEEWNGGEYEGGVSTNNNQTLHFNASPFSIKKEHPYLNIEMNEYSPVYVVNGFREGKDVEDVIIPSTFDDGINGEHPVSRVWGFEGNTTIRTLMGDENMPEDQVTVFSMRGCKNLTAIDPRFAINIAGGSGQLGGTAIEEITMCYTDLNDQGASAGFAYANMENLKTIHLRENCTVYNVMNGVLYAEDTQEYLQLYPAKKAGSYFNIPGTVLGFGDSAFHYASNLKGIYIPAETSLPQYLRSYPFFGCTALKEIRYGGTKAQWKSMLENVWPMYENVDKDKILDGITVVYNAKPYYSMADAKTTGIKASYEYTGSNLKPAPTVKMYGVKLKKDTDYTVTYKANKAVGKATVTIKGKGTYSGSVKKTFKINPKPTAISKVTAASKGFTVKWKKQTVQTTGYEIQYSTSSTFKSGNKTVTVAKPATVSKKITGLKAKKTYYVRIRTYKTVSGTKYYSTWSDAKKVMTK